ncbi:DUF397 domain-containing protein [Streptomyces sp. Ac-502]|uniref:DUF397 domain-containing protein n=1 Tax=Streptomyces sp. Ac-502 TaxID=3342801 RepID=UPI0038627EC9
MTSPTGGRTPAADLALDNARWFKSTASSANGGCLEVAYLDDGRVALRDNEDPDNPPFVVTPSCGNASSTGQPRANSPFPPDTCPPARTPVADCHYADSRPAPQRAPLQFERGVVSVACEGVRMARRSWARRISSGSSPLCLDAAKRLANLV